MTRIISSLIVLSSCGAFGQATTPEFEVASIRAADPNLGLIQNRTPNLNTDPGRNLNFANISVRDMIMLAYGVGARQITGPDWLLSRYNVIARVPAGAAKEQIPRMLQGLLAERFKLALHHEQRSMQVYALEVAKGGSKMDEAAAGITANPGAPVPSQRLREPHWPRCAIA